MNKQEQQTNIEWQHSANNELGLLLTAALTLSEITEIDLILPKEKGVIARIPEKDEVFPPETAKEYFDACGVESNADDPIELAEIQFILEELGGSKDLTGMKILECGSGPGMLAKLMAEAGGSVLATDASPTMIELSREKHAEAIEQLDLDFELAEVRELPFPDGSFDMLVAKHILHQLPTDAAFKFLQETVRVLKEDGLAVIGDYNRLSSRKDRDARLQFTIPEMQPLLEETFDASFTPKELSFMLEQIPGIEFSVLVAEDPKRLGSEIRKKIEDDPVEGHATDWRTRLRVLIHKLPKGGSDES